jgi:PiT family inorganic phosphate transporter
MLALRQTVNDIQNEVIRYGSLGRVPAEMQANVRNQMYLVSETMRLMPKT